MTLIEMMVVLALFAVLSGMVVLAVPTSQTPLRSEVDAKALALALNKAVSHTLLTGRGFAVQTTSDGLRIVQKDAGGGWGDHADQNVARLKLFPDDARITNITGQLFEVSPDLVPSISDPIVLKFGDRAFATNVIFDGAQAWVVTHDGKRKN